MCPIVLLYLSKYVAENHLHLNRFLKMLRMIGKGDINYEENKSGLHIFLYKNIMAPTKQQHYSIGIMAFSSLSLLMSATVS